ncbi:MAG TPA: O-antigen ligase family protein [Allosphingosinicella sp.]|uniref:O-antigen ligase family protein n=1 Tax=Allosphingosinicella sp. TaxID=2823234 RepID=UPI002ED8B677
MAANTLAHRKLRAPAEQRRGLYRVYIAVLCGQFVLTSGHLNLPVDAETSNLLQRGAQVAFLLAAIILGLALDWYGKRQLALNYAALSVLAVIAYCFCGAFWTDDPAAVLSTTLLLAVSTFSAFICERHIGLLGTLRLMRTACLALCLASVLLVALVPSFAISDSYFWKGAWLGVFVAKNGLGYAASYLVALSGMMLLFCRKTRTDIFSLLLGLSVCIGADSRGALLVALSVLLFLVLLRARIIGSIAIVLIAVAYLALLILFNSGIIVSIEGDYLQVGDLSIHLNRTDIWSYAMSLFLERPWLGYGLGAGWEGERADIFYNRFGWVLDNFHSGYIRALVELGLLGAILIFIGLGITLLRAIRTYHASRGNSLPALATAYVTMFLASNVTETYLLRSTDVKQFVFTIVALSIWRQYEVRHLLPRKASRKAQPPAAQIA